jgi:zinc transporter 1
MGSTQQSVFLHMIGDLLGSIVVVANSLFIWLTPFEWRFYVDPVVSLILSIVLSFGAVRLIRSTSLIILQSVPRNIDLAYLRSKIERVAGVLGIHELHVWQLDDNKYICTLHLQFNSNADFTNANLKIKNILHKLGVHNVTVQPEFVTEELVTGDDCAIKCPESSCVKRTCCSPPEGILLRISGDLQ